MNDTVWKADLECGTKMYLYKNLNSRRWYLDNDLDTAQVLEHTPATDAICPSQIRHWLHYCPCYMYTTCSCGRSKWTKTTPPKCSQHYYSHKADECCARINVENLNSGLESEPGIFGYYERSETVMNGRVIYVHESNKLKDQCSITEYFLYYQV